MTSRLPADILLFSDDWCPLYCRLHQLGVMANTAAGGLLTRQLKQMQHQKDIPGLSCGLVDNNVFAWDVMLMISDDCRFYGGRSTPSDGCEMQIH